MAKWGEGDPRWIVEERPDSTNVNNWHWTEKNCLPWTESYLKDKISALKVEQDELSASITSVSVEGESTVGNRKGKIYFIYELQLTIKWKGDSDVASAEGKIKVGDVTQDDDVKDYSYSVTCEADGETKKPIKNLVNQKLLPLVKKVLTDLKGDIRIEHEKNVLLPTKGNAPAAAPATVAVPQAKKVEETKQATKSTKSGNIDTKTISMKIELLASAHDVFDALLKAERLKIWTRSKVDITAKQEFSLFDGNITGKTIATIADKKIEQDWRLRDWPEGHFSRVTIELDQGSNSTELQLTQTGVPSEQFESTSQNWNRFYWNQLKGVFGWGIIN